MDFQVHSNGRFVRWARNRVERDWPGGGVGVVYRGSVYRLQRSNKGNWFIETADGSRPKDACPVSTKTKPSASRPTAADPDAKLKAAIPEMSLPETIRLWRRALEWVEDDEWSKQFRGLSVLDVIYKDWKVRYRRPFNPDEFFDWPNTAAAPGSRGMSTDAWLKLGVLKALGYTVNAADGLGARTRRRILTEVFSGVLPPAFPYDHLREWGEPESAARLKKMAECIAAFARNANRRRDSMMQMALEKWEEDLRWLYNEYYVGQFGFGWPSTALSY